MASIKYRTLGGSINRGTLTLAEYLVYGCGANIPLNTRVQHMNWDNTDYEPFKRAVEKKYGVQVLEASISAR